MWSEGYTAAPGPTEDVYQSVSIEGSMSELPFLLQKRKEGVNHFYFTLTGSESTVSVTDFGEYLNGELAAVELEGAPTLCVTVTLEAYQSKAWLDAMIQTVRPDTLLLKVEVGKRAKLIEQVGQFIADVRYDTEKKQMEPAKQLGRGLFRSTRTHLGLWGVFNGMDNLQAVVDKYSKDIEIFHFGTLELPNLRMRQVEYVNSHGKNVIYTVTPKTCLAEGAQFLSAYAATYEQTTLSFLTKSLIQLGFIPVMASGFTDADFAESILHLLHPFTYRRKYFSANRVYKFIISVEHIEELKVKSEEAEGKEDHVWHVVATTPAATRELTYDKKNKR